MGPMKTGVPAVLFLFASSSFAAADPTPASKPAVYIGGAASAVSLPVFREEQALQKGNVFFTSLEQKDGVSPAVKAKVKVVHEKIRTTSKKEEAVRAFKSGLHEVAQMLGGGHLDQAAPEERNEIRNEAADLSNNVGQFDDSVALSEKVLAQSPDNHDALNHMAQGQYGLGNYEASIRYATLHARLDPKNDESYTVRALSFYAQGNYLQAKEDAERALALNRNNEAAFATLKMAEMRSHPLKLHLNARQFAEAERVEQEYETAVQQANQVESSGPPAVSQAASRFRAKDYWGTISEASKAVESNPKDGQAYYFRAAARNMMGQYQLAVEDAATAIALQPELAAAFDARAMALNRLGRPREALADSNQSLLISPGNAYAFANRAESYEKLGDYRSMLEDYRQASRLNPQFEAAYRRAAKVHAIPIALLPDQEEPADSDNPHSRWGQSFWVLASGLFGLVLIGAGVWHVTSQGPIGASSSKFPAGYKLVRPIGEGGMGVVYEAMDLALGRPVAIKKLKEDKSGAWNLSDLLEEARTVAALRHPNIVGIHSVVEHEGDVYLVFELITGQPLSHILAKQGPLALAQAFGLTRELCGALEYAHRHGVIHRDLKPSNIMITEEGSGKITDFGVARHFTPKGTQTNTVRVVGTPAYMAPEAEQGIVRKESDVFGLAACLFEMLTAKRIYPETASSALKLTRGYVKLSWQNPALPPALDALIDDAIHPNPDKRIHSAGEFFARFERIVASAKITAGYAA